MDRAAGPRRRPGQRRRQQAERYADPGAAAEIHDLLGDAPRSRDQLIEHLHRIQDRFGEIRHRHLAALCDELRIPLAEGYEVATFYARFVVVKDVSPPPLPVVRVCDGLPCLMRGARALEAASAAAIGRPVSVGPCIGQCDNAPAAEVGRRVLTRATADGIADALREPGSATRTTSHADLAAYIAGGGYARLRACLEGRSEVDSVIQILDEAGLRGLGGAGFPAARKWRAVSAEPAPRYVVLNADEGEPGTFKDRWCLETDPHRVLEGLLIACWAVGAAEAYIYLRDEYAVARDILTSELRSLSLAAISPVRVHLRRGAGAYICGEESAMLESIEGRRGYPRHRPPYAAQVGLFGRPTLVQNVETLYWVPEIIERGASWWRGKGRRGRTGLRLFSLSGRVRTAGVYPAPAGISARELIDEFGGGMEAGHTLTAYLPGGAAGGILPASLGDLPLDFDTLREHGALIGSAAIVALSQADRMPEVARELMRFFAAESCGQCTPCRNGTEKALGLLSEPAWDVPLLRELSQCMADASICGLGQAAPNPVLSVLRFWPEAVGADRT